MPHGAGWPPAEPETRAIFRRAPRELWALTGALGGMPYAFDGDPDGIYFEGDRVVGKAIDALPWAERVPALRAAGVGYVVAPTTLPPPFEVMTVLGRDSGVTLHRLEGAAPSVRVATRLFTAVTFDDVVPRQLRPDFDLRTDAVVIESAPSHGTPLPSSVEVIEETRDAPARACRGPRARARRLVADVFRGLARACGWPGGRGPGRGRPPRRRSRFRGRPRGRDRMVFRAPDRGCARSRWRRWRSSGYCGGGDGDGAGRSNGAGSVRMRSGGM